MTSIDIQSLNRQLIQLITRPNVGSKRRPGEAVKILKKLKDMPMILEYLRMTRIGWTINFLRNCDWSEEVKQLAEEIVNNWSKLVAKPELVRKARLKKAKQERVRKDGTKMPSQEIVVDGIALKNKNIETLAKEVAVKPKKKSAGQPSKSQPKQNTTAPPKAPQKRRPIISDDSDTEIEIIEEDSIVGINKKNENSEKNDHDDKENTAPKKSVTIKPDGISTKPKVVPKTSNQPLKSILKNTPKSTESISRLISEPSRQTSLRNSVQTSAQTSVRTSVPTPRQTILAKITGVETISAKLSGPSTKANTSRITSSNSVQQKKQLPESGKKLPPIGQLPQFSEEVLRQKRLEKEAQLQGLYGDGKESTDSCTSSGTAKNEIGGQKLYEKIVRKRKLERTHRLDTPTKKAKTFATIGVDRFNNPRHPLDDKPRVQNLPVPHTQPIITPADRVKIIESRSATECLPSSSKAVPFSNEEPELDKWRVRSAKSMGRVIPRREHKPKWLSN